MAKTKTTKPTQPSAKNTLGLTPTAGYLIIEPMEAQKQTSSGIYLPDTASPDKPQKGTVLAVGADEIVDEDVTRKSPAKVGDVVIYKKWGGSEVKLNGKEYLFSKFEDILAIEG
jgi:chaperonin GroES